MDGGATHFGWKIPRLSVHNVPLPLGPLLEMLNSRSEAPALLDTGHTDSAPGDTEDISQKKSSETALTTLYIIFPPRLGGLRVANGFTRFTE